MRLVLINLMRDTFQQPFFNHHESSNIYAHTVGRCVRIMLDFRSAGCGPSVKHVRRQGHHKIIWHISLRFRDITAPLSNSCPSIYETATCVITEPVDVALPYGTTCSAAIVLNTRLVMLSLSISKVPWYITILRALTHLFNTMTADAAALCIGRSTTVMALIIQDTRFIILPDEASQLSVPSRCWRMIDNTTVNMQLVDVERYRAW